MSKPMQETNEKGQNYADNSISMQIEAIIEEHSHRPVQATKRIMELWEKKVDEVTKHYDEALAKEMNKQELKGCLLLPLSPTLKVKLNERKQ